MDRNVNLRVLDGSKSVALRKESVDRNGIVVLPLACLMMSLSARRAWIEMTLTVRNVPIDSVALRKESVDRNVKIMSVFNGLKCRSPQGERG